MGWDGDGESCAVCFAIKYPVGEDQHLAACLRGLF